MMDSCDSGSCHEERAQWTVQHKIRAVLSTRDSNELHLEVHDVAEGAGRGSLCEWGSPVNHLIGNHSHRPPVTFQAVGASPVLIHHGQYFGSHVVWGPNGEFGIHLETRK